MLSLLCGPDDVREWAQSLTWTAHVPKSFPSGVMQGGTEGRERNGGYLAGLERERHTETDDGAGLYIHTYIHTYTFIHTQGSRYNFSVFLPPCMLSFLFLILGWGFPLVWAPI